MQHDPRVLESWSCLEWSQSSYQPFGCLSLCSVPVKQPLDSSSFSWPSCKHAVWDPEGTSKITHSALSFYRQQSGSPERCCQGVSRHPTLVPGPCHPGPRAPAPSFCPPGKDWVTAVLSEVMQPVSKALFIPGCVGDSKYLRKVINGPPHPDIS